MTAPTQDTERPDLMPLYDATNCISSAAIIAELDGNPERVREALMNAMAAMAYYADHPDIQSALMTLITFTRDVHEQAAVS